jgi:hypothetical protein
LQGGIYQALRCFGLVHSCRLLKTCA